MPDNLNRRQPEDPNTINRNQKWEVDYWSKKLGVSVARLLRAIDTVGPNVEKVKQWLITH